MNIIYYYASSLLILLNERFMYTCYTYYLQADIFKAIEATLKTFKISRLL